MACPTMNSVDVYKANAERCRSMASAAQSDMERYCWTSLATAWQRLEAREQQPRARSLGGLAARLTTILK